LNRSVRGVLVDAARSRPSARRISAADAICLAAAMRAWLTRRSAPPTSVTGPDDR
jgi:hypothetical protein